MDRLNEILTQIDNLGRQGRDIEMLPLFEDAIHETRLRNDRGLLARILNDYGGVLRNTGQYDKARVVLDEAKTIVASTAGVKSQAYVTTLLNAGTNELDSKHFDEAEKEFTTALDIAKQLNIRNIVYVSLCNNLGNLYLQRKDYDKAYKNQKEALSLLRTQENSRVKLAISCSNFAETCRLMGKTDEYESLMNEATELLSNAVGENHPLYATVVNNIATMLYNQGNYQKACSLMEEALPIMERTYGTHSKGYRLLTQNLNIVKEKLGQPGQSVSSSNNNTSKYGNSVENVGSNNKTVTHTGSNSIDIHDVHSYGAADSLEAMLEQASAALMGAQSTSSYDDSQMTQSNSSSSAGQSQYTSNSMVHTGSTVTGTLDEAFLSKSFWPGSGLELSHSLLKQEVYPILKQQFPELLGRMAAGLVGKGSECLGYDDEFSKDHDFEAKVLLFLNTPDYLAQHTELERALQTVSKGHAYVIPTQDFYQKYTKTSQGPKSLSEWRAIPEDFLATATTGEIYFDNLGEFTHIREQLLKYYPEDLWKKYLAFECIKLAQSGQYNFPRCLKRNELVAASLALHEAMNHAMAIVFILNKTYMPFYKWRHRKLQSLPILGAEIGQIIESMVKTATVDEENTNRIERVCEYIIDRLHEVGLTKTKETFLLAHGYEIFESISDPVLKQDSPWSR
ncbi:MAG: DUF4037 domain-containing protein [Veillonella sp.]|uniref:DUF4037 domain-containing protein n=1 Tax=Veillonella sp. TaxID=1926307 RepID=UPI0025CE6B14|nr:DUF4037 domain-containing protein [Veillonella sp.]MBS4913025.1 DUF4037 domain-containing protein [Veillonella sp.]